MVELIRERARFAGCRRSQNGREIDDFRRTILCPWADATINHVGHAEPVGQARRAGQELRRP